MEQNSGMIEQIAGNVLKRLFGRGTSYSGL